MGVTPNSQAVQFWNCHEDTGKHSGVNRVAAHRQLSAAENGGGRVSVGKPDASGWQRLGCTESVCLILRHG